VIALEQVSKRFGKNLAVDGLSLNVGRGEVFGLLGHNGAGKSTAIGMMLGQVWPSAGRILVGGHDVHRHRAAALARVGAIFETPAFYEELTGWRNLQIYSSYTAVTSAKRIAEVVEWVGLTGKEQARVRTYSHGMRARLALAQALLPNPELLILDEPGDGLDPEGLHELRHTIQRLNREWGLTILLSSHLLTEVEQVCTRVAVIRKGRKVFDGPIAEARRQQQRVLLHVNDFAAATAHLARLGLVVEVLPPEHVILADAAQTRRVAHALFEAGFEIDTLYRPTATLEDFYLSLAEAGSRSKAPPAPVDRNGAG